MAQATTTKKGSREETAAGAAPDAGLVARSMRALGRDDLPAELHVNGTLWRRTHTVKHDFFAATGFYADAAGTKAVLKMGRTEPLLGLPMAWLGRRLCLREVRFYTALSDLPNIPPVLGMVGRTGFLHAYVDGRPLAKYQPVPDGFFAELQGLLAEIHRRRIAYVDTNKPENILLGDDGRPHLIDFQISWDLHTTLGDNPLTRWWLGVLQRSDLYHVLKHKRRMRPDEMTDAEKVAAQRRNLAIRTHRTLTRPYFIVRRALFAWLRKKGWLLAEGSK